MFRKVVLLAGVLLMVVTGIGWATTYYVKTDGDDSKDGLSWENAKQTIQAGINAATSDGDEVMAMEMQPLMEAGYIARVALRFLVHLQSPITFSTTTGPAKAVAAAAALAVG